MTSTTHVLDAAPDLIAPVVGYRQWRLDSSGLRSMLCDEPWREATLTARCRARTHLGEAAAPSNVCSCGVYAWYRPCPRTASAGSADLVSGAVVLWGHVELHAVGMRGQFCRVVALALPLSRGRKRNGVREVAERLGVPAVAHRTLPTIATTHGGPVPSQLIPCRVPAAYQKVGLVPGLVHSATSAVTGNAESPHEP